MARMYARKKGRSGSHKPAVKEKPKWLEYTDKEVVKIIEKLAREGYSSAMIGTILRDQYGIPSVKVVVGKSLTRVLEDLGFKREYPEDLYNLMKRAVTIRKHLEKNRKDYQSKRALQLTESKIRRLGKYYVSRGVLPQGWKYDPEQARLITQ